MLRMVPFYPVRAKTVGIETQDDALLTASRIFRLHRKRSQNSLDSFILLGSSNSFKGWEYSIRKAIITEDRRAIPVQGYGCCANACDTSDVLTWSVDNFLQNKSSIIRMALFTTNQRTRGTY